MMLNYMKSELYRIVHGRELYLFTGVPCAIVRAISDKADGSSSMDYPTFEAQAARNSAALVIAMLKRQG